MLFTRSALAALMLGAAGLLAPAGALAAQGKPAATAAPQIKISKGATKAIIALQAAVNANDVANIPAALAAAQAAASTPEDRYFISQMQLKAALAANDQPAQLRAIEAQIASGYSGATRLDELRLVLANAKLKAKDYAGTMAALQPVLQTDPNNTDALLLTAEALNGTGRTAEAVTSLQKAVSVYRASNRPVPQDVYRRLVAFAYLQKMPIAGQLATEWVQAYPSATNWRDAIRIYSSGSGLSENDMIDLFRLQRAAGALAGESDYFRYASTASSRGLPGEAKAVLDEGFASKAIDRARPMFRDTYTLASGRIAADRASLAAAEKAALAGAAAKGAMSTGDAYLGYGDYAKAAAMYRAALTKSGADTSLANLRLGIALGRSGDKAGATAALNAVTGPRAGIAKLWLAWLATRS